MQNIEQSRADFTKLLDIIESCEKTMGAGANMGRALATAMNVTAKIRGVRIRRRGDVRKIVRDILGEEVDELMRAQEAQRRMMDRIIREIGELAHTFGLLIITRPQGTRTANNFSDSLFRIRIQDQDLFRETLEEIQPSKEQLLRLAEGLKEDIFSTNPEKLITSKIFAGLGIIADHESVQNDPFLTRTRDIAKAFDKNMPQTDGETQKITLKRIAIQLFLEFERKMGDKLRVIPTGDASLEYLQEADAAMNAWLEKAKWMYQDPAYALYATQMNALYENALRQYLQSHEDLLIEESDYFETAKKFTHARANRKTAT